MIYIDVATVGISAMTLAIGFLLGRYRRPAGTSRTNPRAPLCACAHGLNYHDPKTGICHAQIRTGDTHDKWENGRKIGVIAVLRSCSCRRYVGPEPLPEISTWGTPGATLPTNDEKA